MGEASKNLSKSTAILVLVIIIVFLIVGYMFFNNLDGSEEGNNILVNSRLLSSDTSNLTDQKFVANLEGEVDLGNTFFASGISKRWVIGEVLTDQINIVKSGSPAQITIFIPEDRAVGKNTPVISMSTFTIDASLSARDVANLIQERNIANKISDGSEPCFRSSSEFFYTNYDTYEFIEDTTIVDLCSFVVTEPSIVHSFITKNPVGSNALLVTFTVVDDREYGEYLYDFRIFADSIRYPVD